MILFEQRRRVRKNGLHAETEEEYLQKLVKQDESRQLLIDQQQLSPSQEGFIINQEFSFEHSISEPILVLQDCPIYKQHFVLVISDDFSMNLKRMSSLLECPENSDNLTDSTLDEQNQQSQIIFKQDYYVHLKNYGNIIHKFHIWILNHQCPTQMFQQQYYPKMEAFIVIHNKVSNSKQDLIQEQFLLLQQFNPKIIQFQLISENEEYSDKQNSFSNILDSLLS